MRQKHFLLTALLMIITIGIFLSCNKKPTDPDPEPVEHLFYIKAAIGTDSSLIKTFSVEQLKFIDSFIIDDFSVGDMAVIGNDDMLMVTGSSNINVYDLETKELINSTESYGTQLQISHNSEYFSDFNPYLQIRRTNNFQLIYNDTEAVEQGEFSYDSRYYIYSRDYGDIIVYNIVGDSVETSFGLTRNGSFYNVEKLWPSTDMSKLFLVGNQGWTFSLAVIDFAQDSVRILQAPLNRGGTDVAVSSNGNYLYFVNAARGDDELPSMKVDVFNIATEILTSSISTKGNDYFEPTSIALTSDGRYMMTTLWKWGPFGVLLIDTKTLSLIEHIESENQFPIICTKR